MGTRLVLALVAVSVATGCGGDGGDGGETGTPAARSATAGDIAAPYDTLVWAFPDGSRKLDYVKSLDTATLSVTRLGVEGLMRIDHEGKVQPSLAESVTQRDKTTYVYKLREGVKFWNGAPLTSADAVYSLNRNLADDAATAAFFGNVKSITADGPTKVVVKLKQPDATWPYVPAFAGQVIEKKFGEQAGDKLGTPRTLTMGTGPWKIVSFHPDSGVELVRNEEWWGGQAPAAKISIKFLDDEAAVALALRAGEIDGVFDPDANSVRNIPNAEVLSAPGTSQVVVSLNTAVEPFDDVHVRRAIAHAVNRDGIVKSVLGGQASASRTIVPLSNWPNLAPQEEVEQAYAELPEYPFDLEAAKRELAQSAHPDGFSTTVPVYTSGASLAKTAQVLAADLAKIGIDLKVQEMPTSQWLEILYGPRDKLGLLVSQYNVGYPDPNFLLDLWLDSSNAVVNGLNSANFENPQVDELIAAQRRSSDPASRVQDILDALRIAGEEAPYVPIYSPQQLASLSKEFTYNGFSSWYPMDAWALYIAKKS